MRTTFDQNDIVHGVLKDSALMDAVTGKLYFEKRPDNSSLEDVVINSIALVPGSVAIGAGNVNIYVPDLANGLPNQARLKVLTALAVQVLQEQAGSDFIFFIENQGVYEGTKCHYANIRLKFRFMGG